MPIIRTGRGDCVRRAGRRGRREGRAAGGTSGATSCWRGTVEDVGGGRKRTSCETCTSGLGRPARPASVFPFSHRRPPPTNQCPRPPIDACFWVASPASHVISRTIFSPPPTAHSARTSACKSWHSPRQLQHPLLLLLVLLYTLLPPCPALSDETRRGRTEVPQEPADVIRTRQEHDATPAWRTTWSLSLAFTSAVAPSAMHCIFFGKADKPASTRPVP